ncbi:hypothetical protein BTO23_04400 [Aliivibrio sifiae]|uniref:CPXCG motif-containing cysteine-rich protein n=2 Tax=Aliivibrio sifiae TaxID=566293 RepID=A0A2S7XIV8_9GAMM|nr:hypothetical protein BTO23_04400 [Aliivibrio sifiae]
MMNYIRKDIKCPNCQYTIGLVIDKNQPSQQIYDDCPSCHRAIEMKMVVNPLTQSVNFSFDSVEDGLF